MAETRWDDLPDLPRRLLIAGAAMEGALKTAALVDLARRPAAEVRGSKPLWAVAIVLINSVGVVPIVYLTLGRRTSASR